ncbi:MAG: DUF1599 domain-containing protein [Bacteroidia bacterium]
MSDTSTQYDAVVNKCKDIFLKKNKDYGTSWRMLRPSSITDQIFIKATRIRGIETKGKQMIDEGIEPEFIGIINYGIMAIVQMRIDENSPIEIPAIEAQKYYEQTIAEVKDLMLMKNHDYGEAWRDMRVSSFTDMILVRLLRIKQIEDNEGNTLVSEGVESNYMDLINYAIFALIQIDESKA